MSRSTHAVNAGTLDPTFAKGGVLKLPTPEFTGYYIEAILPLAENQLLIAVLLPGDPTPIGLAKVKEGGSIDMVFGGAGTGLVKFSLEDYDLDVRQLCGLSDGGWLVIGQYSPLGSGSGGVYVLRYFQDGWLDTFFGEGGVRLLPYRGEARAGDREEGPAPFGRRDRETSAGAPRASGAKGVSAVVQSDGKIVLSSVVRLDSGPSQAAVFRLNPNGSIDDTFNGSGFAIIELPGIPYDRLNIYAVVVQADGKVLVAGEYIQDSPPGGVYVIRLDATGRLETSFNGGVGAVTVAVPNSTLIDINAMALRASDGAIVAAGEIRRDRYSHGLMFVLTHGGFFDFAFNRGQPLLSSLVTDGQQWRHCAWQADGSIVVAGITGRGFVEEGTTALTARFRSDGSLDPTFNENGFVLFDEKERYETVVDMALMPNGRIVVGGFTWLGGSGLPGKDKGWIIRYLA
ncbi:delta-60 repeat domain-containing protein [Pseudomonas thivervalensis]|uniref:delta-60 repeat domain-containing protein n=1 Tax=Pseudomonas thivervalensis TaxID=86265 RepID=UPI00069DB363|nr:delta-60 repeat domain-containing protein [Pseudomonas thivervalensis]OAB52085.1 hypothetical protein APS14_27095 [Pseudomonas thivervalensis]SDG81297.1 delta-60 repeat domain-containing protein [Pseudomonas thivervalensis]